MATMGSSRAKSLNGVTIAVKRIARIPITDRDETKDIALLQLENPVKFSNSIYPICVPSETFKPKNKRCNAAGYGSKSGGCCLYTL